MKLYIKQKLFSWGDKFTVKDAGGTDRYFVEGEVFSFGKKLHIYDTAHTERAYIKQELLTWMPKYSVYINGDQIAQVKREFTFFRPKYTIIGPNWEAEGDFFAHEYQVTHSGRVVATISKEWMTWGDSYELDIADGVNEITALAVVLAIDAVIESNQNNN
jgi:uncharacterized protein YxjI